MKEVYERENETIYANNHCDEVSCSIKKNEVIKLMTCLALCIRQKTEEEPQDWGGADITNIGLQNSKLKSEDFDKKVREICKAKGKSVLNKISVTCLANLVEHWRKYYQ